MDQNFAENKLYEAMAKEQQDGDGGELPAADVIFPEDDNSVLKQYKTAPPPAYVGDSPVQVFWNRLGLVVKVFLLFLLILVLAVQGATLHRLITNPDSDSNGVGATDALSGTDASPTAATDMPTMSPGVVCNFTELLNYVRGALDQTMSLSDNQILYILNNTNILQDNLASTEDLALKLTDIAGTLANLQGDGITTQALVNDILSVVKTLLDIQNNVTEPIPDPKSCQDVKMNNPNSTSGYYHIHSQIVYCNMDTLCGSDDGWTRIGLMDMTDSTTSCPTGFRTVQNGNVRACGRPTKWAASCSSIKMPSNGISYSNVCGRVTGYQLGSPDALSPGQHHNNIDEWYVDGVSVTMGYPRQHLWTFINGYSGVLSNCPCSTPPSSQTVQSFVGNYYFCESGNPYTWWSKSLYNNDPLWDGKGCQSKETKCCDADGLPWFSRSFNETTTDYVELRVCGDQGWDDEDTPIGFYEIYVK